ncbi:LysR substrate-binding domain-containing protein [Pseudomonas benzenivorans]|uniref:LysR family transcriptional regulator n=1 Tax=Pseudomonas benzenivorans TaxID=556533 RepID=A0ABY5H9R9_9PSED|nr:LysR substrate-binding domain-containing protein [Pseudomonas benzenivorans]UTW08561.1 LysR family transcriptional regulator [Pseudomonas benzenivorans]
MKALIAFEAAFRLGSMTAAAQEQGTTQPVISQRIRALEESIGRVLFDRTGNRLTPTDQGRFLFAELSSALSSINTAVEKLRDEALDVPPSLSIAANFGFAHAWLLPRLGALQQAFPRYRFEIAPADSESALEMGEADIAIRFGALSSCRANEVQLVREVVFPVCSPAFAQRHDLTGRVDEQVLSRVPLLHMDQNNPRWLDWAGWCVLAGLAPAQETARFKFNNYPLLISAVLRGEGMALGWAELVQQAVAEGQLVALQPEVIRSDHGYLLASRHRNSRLVQPVIDWFQAELGQSPHAR